MKIAAALVVAAVAAPCLAGGLAPVPYTSFADSPFNGPAFTYFHLENFEDGVLNTPGVTLSAGASIIASPGPQTDSVDADDGPIDGTGVGGRSLLALQTNSFRLDFDPVVLGALPTNVGIVWTDVGTVSVGAHGFGNVEFRAFDATSSEIATIVTAVGDGTTFGQTAEDLFLGAFELQGIAYITITMPESQDWEVDHLQYGLIPTPGATAVIGLCALTLARRRR